MEPTSPGGSTDWGTTHTFGGSSWHWKTNSRPTGPHTTYAGAKCSSGNAADPSTEAAPTRCSIPAGGAANEPACCSIPAGSAANESACCSIPAGSAATKPACYPVPAGCAATKEASREGRGSSTSLQQHCSCCQSTCPGTWMAADQGTWSQRQVSQSPGHGWGSATSVLSTTTPGATLPQPGHRARTRHFDPTLLAAKYRSSGWQKDLEHVLKVYYRYNLQAPFVQSEWVLVRELFFDRFVAKKAKALRLKEESPLNYMPFIAEEFYRATGICLHELPEFTWWIKKGSYFHGQLVHRGQVEECPHLIGAELPKWPQPKPSESCQDSYTRAEGPVAGSSEPATWPTAAPTQETPTEEPSVAEAPMPGPSHSNTPALMETGRAGDGQSWADQAEASTEAEFRQARPLKCPRSQSRKWEAGLALPFPLQDTEERLTSVMRLYEHVRDQPPPRGGVAGKAIRHLHPHILPRNARHLGNQVVCMIAEYHLTSSTRVLSTLSPVLPEAAKPLLPALKTYVPNISFEGTQDVRVLDHAKTLRVAVWLHRLDMATRGDEMASETLDVSQHCLGHLLESFLVPATHDLSFSEVVVHCLYENQCDAQHRLNDLVMHCIRVSEELDGLVEAHRAATGSS